MPGSCIGVGRECRVRGSTLRIVMAQYSLEKDECQIAAYYLNSFKTSTKEIENKKKILREEEKKISYFQELIHTLFTTNY